MKVNIRNIPADGLDFDRTVAAEQIGLVDKDFKVLSPLNIRAFIEKADDAIIAHTTVEGAYEMTCGRCLDPIEKKRRDTFDLFFEINPEDDFIDLGEDIRQEMLIKLSSIMMSAEEAGGRCPYCGRDLENIEIAGVKIHREDSGKPHPPDEERGGKIPI